MKVKLLILLLFFQSALFASRDTLLIEDDGFLRLEDIRLQHDNSFRYNAEDFNEDLAIFQAMEEQEESIRKRKIIIYIALAGIILLGGFTILLFFMLQKQKKLHKQLLERNAELKKESNIEQLS